MTAKELINKVNFLVSNSSENEWIEFKHNFHSIEEIGERISALSNSACIHNQSYGYLVFGIEDGTHKIIGTTFKPKSHKKGNQELEMWLTNKLRPNIDFESFEFEYEEGIHISLYRIPAATSSPIKFDKTAYVRVGSATTELGKHKNKEAKIWKKTNKNTLSEIIAKPRVSAIDIISLLSAETYFTLMKIPYPQDTGGVIERFLKEKLIVRNDDSYDITKLGAILFAKDLSAFDTLNRKAIRVVVYKGKDKTETIREQIEIKGYALGFERLIEWINGQLPANEEIGKALRENVKMYPEISIRELVANSIIHQNLDERGFPMIEIYSDRVEISNPGTPLISDDRFIDEYVSRNELLADIMRRMGICEEKGSGLDKTIRSIEHFQLPAIRIKSTDIRTTVTIFSYKKWAEIDKNERIAACYQHACLKYVSNEKMTNTTLRERLSIEDKNSAMASRIIRDTLTDGLIKAEDPDNKSRKHKSYIPYWA